MMDLDYETVMTIQGYAKFFFTLIVFVIFVSYAYSLYKRDYTGERDFEKYSDIVHNDSFDTPPLEEIIDKDQDIKKEKLI